MGRTIVILIAVLVCAHVGLAAEPSDSDRVVVREGIRYVMNPSVAAEPAVTLPTTELWRRGGEDDEVVFGTIGGITSDRRDNAYLLDDQLNTLHVIAPDGRYKGTVGREGEGPAEFRMASGIVLLSDSVLCVSQVMPPRAVKMTTTGRALGDHPLSRDLVTAFINGCAVVDGRLAVKIGQMTEDETSVGFGTTFGVLNEEGELAETYWKQFQKADFANITFDEKADAEPVWAFAPDGRLFINNDWDRYAIEVMGAGNHVQHVIERAYEHLPRTRAELEAVEQQKVAGKIAASTTVAVTVRDVVRLFPRRGGSLWVLSSRGDTQIPDGAVAVFDEFDRTGVFVRSVTVQGARRPYLDALYLVDDLLFVVVNGAEGRVANSESNTVGELEIVCMRLDNAHQDG